MSEPEAVQQRWTTTSHVGLVNVFNVMVGVGVLALPEGFYHGGWVAGVCVIPILSVMSFISSLDVMEALTVARVVCGHKTVQAILEIRDANVSRTHSTEIVHGEVVDSVLGLQRSLESHWVDRPVTPAATRHVLDTDEDHLRRRATVLIEAAELIAEEAVTITVDATHKFEICELALVLIHNKVKRCVVYICLFAFLFTDLATYESIVSTALTHVTCTYRPKSGNYTDSTRCWESWSVTRLDMYRVYITGFVIITGPVAFFPMMKPLSVQVLSFVVRAVALTIMIVWNIHKLVKYGQQGQPPLFNMLEMPLLLGTSLYCVMWHLWMPGLIQPIGQDSVVSMLIIDYSISSVFNIFLPMTSIFTFATMKPLYNLNFLPEVCPDCEAVLLLGYFLALYPVITLLTKFPLSAIILKNNLRLVCLSHKRFHNCCQNNVLFALTAVLVPTILALCIRDIHLLFSWVVSIAGVGVQYLIPTFLVTAARDRARYIPADLVFSRPFHAKHWPKLTYAFTGGVWTFIITMLILGTTQNHPFPI